MANIFHSDVLNDVNQIIIAAIICCGTTDVYEADVLEIHLTSVMSVYGITTKYVFADNNLQRGNNIAGYTTSTGQFCVNLLHVGCLREPPTDCGPSVDY